MSTYSQVLPLHLVQGIKPLPRSARLASTGRPMRIALLLSAIAVLSMLDLGLTLRCMQTTGMFEANPIVHQLARVAHPALAIGAFKLSTVAFSVGVLYALGRRWQAELASWFLVAVLCVLTIQWVQYLELRRLGQPLIMANDATWIQLG
ncbi:MAG: DUF5658 family protein [Phycisphaerales bacterium]|nr:DUF5658 family protein [Phycisphaerales bacterium]